MTSNTVRTNGWKRWVLGLCIAITMLSAGCSLLELSEQTHTSATEVAQSTGFGPKNNIGT